LTAFNGEYIRRLGVDELFEACRPWMPDGWADEPLRSMMPYIQERLKTLADAPGLVDFLYLDEPEIDTTSWDQAFGADYAAPLLRDMIAEYAVCPWDHASLKAAMEQRMEQYGIKLNKASAGTRVAVTGRTVGPPLFEALEVMGRDEALRRMRAALDRL
jgi:glutamyl-tRNA synthetase